MALVTVSMTTRAASFQAALLFTTVYCPSARRGSERGACRAFLFEIPGSFVYSTHPIERYAKGTGRGVVAYCHRCRQKHEFRFAPATPSRE